MKNDKTVKLLKSEASDENLIYLCTVIEYIVRIRFENRENIVKALGKENLENLYKGIEVWSCHTYQATVSIFAERGNIPYGTYDFIQRSRTNIVNPRVVGKKYALMIENLVEDEGINIIDAIYKVYSDEIIEKLIEGRLIPDRLEDDNLDICIK